VAEQVVEFLEPVQERYREIRSNQSELDDILADGATKARARAQETLRKVQDALGFVPPKRSS
jgi:tryptophanyl-tRNA synthetase